MNTAKIIFQNAKSTIMSATNPIGNTNHFHMCVFGGAPRYRCFLFLGHIYIPFLTGMAGR